MRIILTEKMKKKVAKGGSVLKACRTRVGGAKGLMAGGITLVVSGVLTGLPFLMSGPGGLVLLCFFGIPGLLCIISGAVLQVRKAAQYTKFYSEQTGYSESDILMADRELLMPQTAVFGNSASRKDIRCYITEHFLVSVTRLECYVRRLEDLRAAFYSEEIPGAEALESGMVFVSRQEIEGEPRINPYTYRKCGGDMNGFLNRESCAEIAEELNKRAPHVITSQKVVRGGVPYDLMGLSRWSEDWRELERREEEA